MAKLAWAWKPATAALLAAAALSTVAGCSSGSEASVPAGDTKPGTALPFGTMATVRISQDKGAAAEGITVLDVSKANMSDFQQLQHPEEVAGKTAYYVHYRITKTDATATTGIQAQDLILGSDPDHLLGGMNVLNFNPFDDTPNFPCEPALTEHLNNQPAGSTLDGCAIFLQDAGDTSAVKAMWVGQSVQNYEKKPIVWQ
ncbi:hypothetical protein KGQ19_10595 [Catenulispora sp. NL8]|uniref:Lipoprotein n=1 Tax=Catenulispora pinistramenti TaxID=2705254 RepID=A0ABS5KMS3_9ACTN|nr:hypothetical protein [Catenulispora pinistramenti]MBS2547322.1 hypothetical protein [Catenulispora pinistramenti]